MSPFGEYNVKYKVKEKEIRLSGRKVCVTMKTMKGWNNSLQGDMEASVKDSRTNW